MGRLTALLVLLTVLGAAGTALGDVQTRPGDEWDVALPAPPDAPVTVRYRSGGDPSAATDEARNAGEIVAALPRAWAAAGEATGGLDAAAGRLRPADLYVIPPGHPGSDGVCAEANSPGGFIVFVAGPPAVCEGVTESLAHELAHWRLAARDPVFATEPFTWLDESVANYASWRAAPETMGAWGRGLMETPGLPLTDTSRFRNYGLYLLWRWMDGVDPGARVRTLEGVLAGRSGAPLLQRAFGGTARLGAHLGAWWIANMRVRDAYAPNPPVVDAERRDTEVAAGATRVVEARLAPLSAQPVRVRVETDAVKELTVRLTPGIGSGAAASVRPFRGDAPREGVADLAGDAWREGDVRRGCDADSRDVATDTLDIALVNPTSRPLRVAVEVRARRGEGPSCGRGWEIRRRGGTGAVRSETVGRICVPVDGDVRDAARPPYGRWDFSSVVTHAPGGGRGRSRIALQWTEDVRPGGARAVALRGAPSVALPPDQTTGRLLTELLQTGMRRVRTVTSGDRDDPRGARVRVILPDLTGAIPVFPAASHDVPPDAGPPGAAPPGPGFEPWIRGLLRGGGPFRSWDLADARPVPCGGP